MRSARVVLVVGGLAPRRRGQAGVGASSSFGGVIRAAIDPRSQLISSGAPRAVGANVAPQAFEFGRLEPAERTAGGSALWWVRSQAIVYNQVDAAAGDTLVRTGQADEYVVLVPQAGAVVTVQANGVATAATGPALVVVPPGDSSVTASAATTVIRLFAAATAPDLVQRCTNVDVYVQPDPNVAPFEPWPAPVDGHRVRVYSIDEYRAVPERFGRIFRCSTFMINWFYVDPGPRDPAKLSPHYHDDFEQLSLQLEGDYVHHIRTPWTADMGQWRDDEHLRCASPAVTVIPPPSIHTSQGVGDTPHQLIDIFCPPRADFSERAGWVLNADEYPRPAG